MPKKDTKILIRLDKNGITLDPGQDDCYVVGDDVEESKACAWTSKRVDWTSDPTNLRWEVDFGNASPFTSGRVFRSSGPRGGHIRNQRAGLKADYKYVLRYWEGGQPFEVDPKLVIQDSGESILTGSARSTIRRLDEFAEDANELAATARTLARETLEALDERTEEEGGDPASGRGDGVAG